MAHLPSQLEKVVVEEFDGIFPKFGVFNWKNILKPIDLMKCWRKTFYKIHNFVEFFIRQINCETCDLLVCFMLLVFCLWLSSVLQTSIQPRRRLWDCPWCHHKRWRKNRKKILNQLGEVANIRKADATPPKIAAFIVPPTLLSPPPFPNVS